MAQAVTPGDGLSPNVKKTSRSASRSASQSARGSGMAQAVTPGDGQSPPSRISTPSALRSGSASIGTAVAASLATPSQSAQTVHSSPAQTSGGLRLKKNGTPDQRYSQNWIPKSKS